MNRPIDLWTLTYCNLIYRNLIIPRSTLSLQFHDRVPARSPFLLLFVSFAYFHNFIFGIPALQRRNSFWLPPFTTISRIEFRAWYRFFESKRSKIIAAYFQHFPPNERCYSHCIPKLGSIYWPTAEIWVVVSTLRTSNGKLAFRSIRKISTPVRNV